MKLTLALALSTSLLALSAFGQQSAGTSGGTGASAGSGGAGASVGTGGATTGTGAGAGVGGSGSLSVPRPSTPSVGGQTQLQGGQPNGGVGANAGVGNDASASGNLNVNQSPNNQQPNNQQPNNQQPNNQQTGATNQPNTFPTAQSTNQPSSTNGAPSPTSQSGATNRVYGTNSFGATNGAGYLHHDQAITAQDQALLAQMRQAVFPPNQPMAPWMSSIHFILKDGAVRLVGTVPSLDERLRIEALVKQIPGVTRVYDVLAVNASAGAAAGPADASVNGGAAINATGPTPATGNPNATGGVVVPP